MEWDSDKQDHELHDFYKLMIALRKQHNALRQGRFRFLQATKNDPCIVYERLDDKMHFTIWMNNTDKPRTLSHPMETEDWRDALSNEIVKPKDKVMNISLDPYGFRILYRHLS
ncbi:Cyclomaltodextrinase [compost metagenome]